MFLARSSHGRLKSLVNIYLSMLYERFQLREPDTTGGTPQDERQHGPVLPSSAWLFNHALDR